MLKPLHILLCAEAFLLLLSLMFIKGKNIIVGRNPVLEALKLGSGVDRILIYRNATGDILTEIKKVARDLNVPVQLVPGPKLDSLTNVQHQGIVAFKTLVQYHDLQDIIDQANSLGKVPLFLILDSITDVRNIGAIARTALCTGVTGIIIPDKGVAALGEDAMKASAGALSQIHIIRVNSLLKAVDTLHLNGILVYGSVMGEGKPIDEMPLNEPCAIVMGSEDKGIQPALSKACDANFHIPMPGNFESLNVSVAAGMILYETVRQRRQVDNG
jgi:23S rRNA (guanosine2251-2'-O)-methyltransferase